MLWSDLFIATTPLRPLGIALIFRKTRSFRNKGNVGFNYENFLAMPFRGLILRELGGAINSLPSSDLQACATFVLRRLKHVFSLRVFAHGALLWIHDDGYARGSREHGVLFYVRSLVISLCVSTQVRRTIGCGVNQESESIA